ncbi:MAG: ROK family protein, partial [Sphingopyxis sp.]|nr:ROK family protein [Sphingopyxis sp.]
GHSEAGHQRVPKLPGDLFEGCCIYHGDCVEGLASGPAIAARAGKDGREIAPDDDAWNYAAHAIAMLSHNLVLTTLPQRILIGGGVAIGQPQLLTAVRHHLDHSLAGYRQINGVEDLIVLPGLGERAGPCGSLALASRAAN